MLIGLIGKKRVGKDTLAEHLVGEHGFIRVAFADPLRQAALDLDPIVGATVVVDEYVRLGGIVESVGWEKAKGDYEVRRTLQRLGVAIRNLDPDFWLRMGLEEAAKHEHAVITDVRFRNEAKAVEKAGGVTIRITRETGLTDTHVSETELDDWTPHYVLSNEGDIESLHMCADMIVHQVHTKKGADE